MSSPLLRPVRARSGAPTFVARRRDGRVCLAHRVEPERVAVIEALRGLRHPHLAATLGVAMIDDAPHALVELRPAEPLSRLRDRLARAGRAGLPVPVMVGVAAQVADAAAALHARGLVHGSIDARRVAITYAGEAVLLDAPLCVGAGAAADDVAAVGRLLDALCVDTPVALLDLARRAREGAVSRASDLAAALDAWRRVDAKAAAIDEGRVARWMSRVCAARLEVWRAASDVGDPRALDALVALLGPPREAPRAWVAEAETVAPRAPRGASGTGKGRGGVGDIGEDDTAAPGPPGDEEAAADDGAGHDGDPLDAAPVDLGPADAALDEGDAGREAVELDEEDAGGDAVEGDEADSATDDTTDEATDAAAGEEAPWHWPRIVAAVSVALAAAGGVAWWLLGR